MPPLYKEGLYWLVLLARHGGSLRGPDDLRRADAGDGSVRAVRPGRPSAAPVSQAAQGVAWDERDTLINYRAVIASYSVFWLFFTAATMGTWAAVYCYGAHSTISVHVLPNLMMGGLLVLMTTRAVAIVVQYGLLDTGKGE